MVVVTGTSRRADLNPSVQLLFTAGSDTATKELDVVTEAATATSFTARAREEVMAGSAAASAKLVRDVVSEASAVAADLKVGVHVMLAVEVPASAPVALVPAATGISRPATLAVLTLVTISSYRASGVGMVAGDAEAVTMESASTCRALPQPADANSRGVSADADAAASD